MHREGRYPVDARPIAKRCARCSLVLDWREFHDLVSNGIRYLQSYCRSCSREYHREWLDGRRTPAARGWHRYMREYGESYRLKPENRKRQRRYQREYRRENRMALLMYYQVRNIEKSERRSR